MPLTQSARFRWALLERLSWEDASEDEDGWESLYDVLYASRELAINKYNMRRDLANSTLKSVRKDLQYSELIETRRDPSSRVPKWQIRITRRGLAEAKLAPSSQRIDARVNLPEPTYRVGKDHLLPAKAWSEVGRQVRDGTIDLIIIDHSKATPRIQYWDAAEGDEDEDL